MLIVRFTSGLGNQMFQYSLYTLLKEKYKDIPVKADLSWFARMGEHQGFELKKLFEREDNPEFVLEAATDLEIFRCMGRIPNHIKGNIGELYQRILRIPHQIVRMTCGDKLNERRVDQTGNEDVSELYDRLMNLDISVDHYITGFFIEEIFYRDRLSQIREHLRFSDMTGENARLEQEIKSCNSVSIHVRRGDYLSAKYNTSFIVLPMDYYKKAAMEALAKWPDARFYVFSDDKDFISEGFSWLYEAAGGRVRIVTGNEGSDSYRDMQLMSLCKGNIIANSTFSTWAGLLNQNEDSIVYYPAIYMHEKNSEYKTIKGWTRIDG